MRLMYALLGLVSFGLGAIGVVLPVLPTTPFLLLSAFCFGKSSKRLHDWFIQTTLYKRHLEDFVTHREMTLATKIKLLSFASTMLLIAFITVDVIYARICILVVMAVKFVLHLHHHFCGIWHPKFIGISDSGQQRDNLGLPGSLRGITRSASLCRAGQWTLHCI